MSEKVLRVPLTAVNLTGIAPSDGINIPLPEDTVAFDIMLNGAKLSSGGWGFQLVDGSGVVNTGYKQGHAKFTSSSNSVSSAGTWFVVCSHDNSTQDWYGTARFFTTDDPADRWGYSGEVWQVSSTGGETRIWRPCGGNVNLASPVEALYLWGTTTNTFISGTLSIVAWVKDTSI